jgi:hypothetical protein
MSKMLEQVTVVKSCSIVSPLQHEAITCGSYIDDIYSEHFDVGMAAAVGFYPRV